MNEFLLTCNLYCTDYAKTSDISEIGLFFPCWYLVIAVTSYNENDNVDESVMSLS